MAHEARFIRADRDQTRFEMIDLEGMLPADHQARVVWEFVGTLDLSALYEAIKSVEGAAGRPASDPAVLMALWLYATIDGVGSARELDRLCNHNPAYRWLAGGVPLNHHMLSDFRVEHETLLDRLLTESVTALKVAGTISLAEVAIDGTKVRANASRDSFKTESKLEQVEAEMEQRIAALKSEVHSDTSASSRRKHAARKRAAEEVKGRAQVARVTLNQLRAERAERAKTHPKDEAKKSEPKASLTDSQARVMCFPDGAMRPAYNAQIAITPREGIIVSVEMTDRRNDSGLAGPVVEDIVRRYGETPETLLVDTHYATSEDICELAEHPAGPVTVYAPPPKDREDVKPETIAERAKKREREPPAVKEWRARMATASAKALYRRRKLIERINAHLKNHGFGFMPVRGIRKAKAVALWHALANNLIAAHRLRTQSVSMAIP
jgi:transposase